ncbi:unnamed protein product [Macrosiphum euphorbiae]|uniref:Uncharacterized protein n=1 Tax=Macrosiphum euphorbiae TaxID=13131 RepID=A0AAV0XNL7_9HEMI|nr:unnamed protein product [Macrosiphum euphorbiae]
MCLSQILIRYKPQHIKRPFSRPPNTTLWQSKVISTITKITKMPSENDIDDTEQSIRSMSHSSVKPKTTTNEDSARNGQRVYIRVHFTDRATVLFQPSKHQDFRNQHTLPSIEG